MGIGVLQFGHELSAVETLFLHPIGQTCRVLQFGHDLSAVETLFLHPIGQTCRVLQFGHDLSAVETCPKFVRHDFYTSASIRPRPFSRGNASSDCKPIASVAGFNTATTFQPWKQDIMNIYFFYHASFNTATTFQPWKPEKINEEKILSLLASIRPRPFSRGNVSSKG